MQDGGAAGERCDDLGGAVGGGVEMGARTGAVGGGGAEGEARVGYGGEDGGCH